MDAAQGDTTLKLEQAVALLESLQDAENHFDDVKTKCRGLASTWLLATFGAMGFAVTQKLAVDLPTEVLVLALAIAGSMGILLLWILDMLVYHRLLDASFQEACRMEAAYPQLPQVRRNMKASQPGGQTTYYEQWFYIGGMAAPLAFAGPLFVRWCFQLHPASGTGVAIALVAAVAAVLLWVGRMSPNPMLGRPDGEAGTQGS